MTLNEMIVGALQQLKRGSDSQTIDNYRGRFTQYANMAQQDLAKDFPLYRTDRVETMDGTLDVNGLSRWCMKVISVRQGIKNVSFDWNEANGLIAVAADGEIEVRYRYAPKPLENPTDVPDVPEQLHQCMVSYMVACDRAEGDPSTQGGASLYFEQYRDQKRGLMRGGMGTPYSYKIVNMERW